MAIITKKQAIVSNANDKWLEAGYALKAPTVSPIAPTQDNIITNKLVAAWTLPQNQIENVPQQPSTMDSIKNLPQYQWLLDKWYTEKQITEAVSAYKAPQTQVQPSPITPVATPIAPVAPVQAPVQKQGPVAPKKDMNKTNTMELLPVSEYQDNSTERQNSIVSNLNQYRQSAPQFMGNINTFKDTFAYEKRSPEQQKLLDSWYTGYQRGVELSNISNSNLLDMYSTGQVSNNDLENLKLNNPNKYAEVMTDITKRQTLDKYSSQLNWEKQETINKATPLAAPLDDNTSFFDEYKKAINSDEVKTLNTEMWDKQAKMDALDLEMNSIEDEIRKQYEWTWATESKIGRIVADAQKIVQKQKNALGIDYNNTLNKYNSLVNTAKQNYELNLAETNYQNQQKKQKMDELGFYYQYDPKWIAEQATAKYNAENPDMDSTDPTKQKQALNQTLDWYYKDYGMIIQRPKSQVINDIQALAKSKGISVSQALKENFITPLQGKSEYKALVNKALGIEAPKPNERKIETDENGNITIVQTWAWSLPESATRQQRVQAYTGIVNNNVSGWLPQVASAIQTNIPDGTKGGQCWVFANDISTAMWSTVHFWDTLASKTSQINSQTPEVWSFIVMTSKSQPWSWHVGMVTGVNPDWTVQVKDSNWKPWSETVSTHTLTQDEMKQVKWYVKPTLNPKKSETKEQATEITGLRKEFNALPQVKEYNTVKQMYNTIESAANQKTAAGDLSLIFSYMKILDPNSTVREWEFANAQNAGWIEDKVRNSYNKVMKGTRLSDNQRSDFLGTAKTLVSWYENTYNQLLNQYRSYPVLGWDTNKIGQEYQIWSNTPQARYSTPSDQWVWSSASMYDQAMWIVK